VNPLLLRQARVRFDRPQFPLDQLARTLADGLAALEPLPRGSRVAITAGSRGVANIGRITRAIVEALQTLGLEPFIIPAMGSHGGATAAGQLEVLASYGITEAAMGCPIRASMDVVELDSAGLGHPLYMDAHAASADRILLINRIKPHTDFHGRYESGLAKMSVIGLGKAKQAEVMHSFGIPGIRDLVAKAAERVLGTGKIWGGVGIVENAYDETAAIEVIASDRILEREPQLLEQARANMPRLPVDRLDVLLVDELGKNISGTGLDTNIIGRMRIPGEAEPASPSIRAIVVSRLTEKTHGNGIGVGLVDVITERLLAQIDRHAMTTNVITSGFLERGKVPIAAPTDAAAYAVALRTCGRFAPGTERVMRIRNTLLLDEVFVSSALEAELTGRSDIEIVGEPQPAFDAAGTLAAW
jgi:hypothetical protein